MDYLTLSIISMVMFGVELSISKIATGHISAESIALIRCIVAGAVIATFMAYTKIPMSVSRFSIYAVIAGVFLAFGFITLFRAFASGPASVVAPIFGLSCMIPAIFGIIALHEPVTVSKAVGMILACAAIVLISR